MRSGGSLLHRVELAPPRIDVARRLGGYDGSPFTTHSAKSRSCSVVPAEIRGSVVISSQEQKINEALLLLA